MQSNNKTAGIVAGVLALVIAIGGVVWFVNREDTTTTSNENTSQTEPAPNEQASQDIVALASATAELSTLVTAVQAAGLVETLQGTGPYTVFAPTNDAFAALPAGTLDTLLKPESKDRLTAVLTYHVVPGKVMAADLQNGQVVTTVQGGTLTVELTDGKVFLVDATGNKVEVVTADVEASNGVVHVINGVLLPQ